MLKKEKKHQLPVIYAVLSSTLSRHLRCPTHLRCHITYSVLLDTFPQPREARLLSEAAKFPGQGTKQPSIKKSSQFS